MSERTTPVGTYPICYSSSCNEMHREEFMLDANYQRIRELTRYFSDKEAEDAIIREQNRSI